MSRSTKHSAQAPQAKTAPEHGPFLWNRTMLWTPGIGRIFCGEPSSTSPENAPASHFN
jgi:hypothetical protein